jgi:hypothetical protein
MSTLSLNAQRLLLVLALLWAPLVSASHPKTDVITLYNGDRLTGEIEALAAGRIALNTNAMGVVQIEWKEVASIVSDYQYEVRLVDGQRLFGTVGAGDRPGNVAFRDVFGDQALEWTEIVELRPIAEAVINRLEVDLSANYAFTKASGVEQTELRATVSYEDEKALNQLTSRLTLSNTDDDSTTSSRINFSRYVWTKRRSLFRVGFGGFESNDELGLDSRITLGGGLGRFFLTTNNSNLTGFIALQALEERSVGCDTQESLEAVLSGSFSRWRFDSPELDLSLGAQLYPSLTESGRLRADTNATLRWEFYRDIFWNISAWGSYDNAAVDEEAGEFDWGITTGLGWSF